MSPIQKFQESYITSLEIARRLGITQNGVNMARRRGALPEGIAVGHMFIYDRKEVEEIIRNWSEKQ
jgi:hypothetical protein